MVVMEWIDQNKYKKENMRRKIPLASPNDEKHVGEAGDPDEKSDSVVLMERRRAIILSEEKA